MNTNEVKLGKNELNILYKIYRVGPGYRVSRAQTLKHPHPTREAMDGHHVGAQATKQAQMVPQEPLKGAPGAISLPAVMDDKRE